MNFQEVIKNLVEHYGYAAIYLLQAFGIMGLPLPDETMLVFWGFLISQGTFSIIPAYLCGILGAMTGITFSYLIGRLIGEKVITRYGKYLHITEESMKKYDNFVNKYGSWVLVFGYFIPGVRHLSAISTGISELKYKTFAKYAYTGAVIWVSTFITLGYVLGKQWEKYKEMVSDNLILISGILLIIALVATWIGYRRSSKAVKK